MKFKFSTIAGLAIYMISMTMSAQAINLYWDGTDTVAGNADGGNGTWDTGTLNWMTNATIGVNRTWAANTANFGGAAGTVSVASPGITVYGIVFSTTGYLIQNNTITFGSTPSITINPGVTANISSALNFAGKEIQVLGGGSLNLTGGTTGTAANKFTVNGGTTVNWTGIGTLGDAGNYVGLGNSTGPGILNVTAGSLTIIPQLGSTRSLFIGNNSSTSQLNISGGTVTINNNADIRIGAGIGFSGDGSTTKGELTVSGTGTFTTGTTVGLLWLGGYSVSTGTVNINSGGTFATLRSFTKGPGTSVLNFNGGTLQATGGITNWIRVSTANVRNGGALIDVGSFAVTNTQALVHSTIDGDNTVDGGLTKLGSGTLTLMGANTYTGPTAINAGTLALSGSGSLSGTTNISLLAGATFDVYGAGFTVAATQTLACGSTNGAATVNASGQTLTLSSGAVLSFQATGGTDTSSSGKISVTGDLNLNDNAVTVNINGSELALGTYRLLECSGTLTGGTTLTLTGTALSGGKIAELRTTTGSAGHVDLLVSIPGVAFFSGLSAAPAISYGTDSITLTGTISADTVYPDNGEEVSATINGNAVTGTVSNNTGSFSINYNDSSLASLTAGSYTITYVYTGHVGRLSAATNTSTSLTVNKLVPAFSGLSASTNVAYGTTSLTLTGKVSAGTVYPANGDLVSATINGNAVTGTVTDTVGNFSITYNPASLATLAGGIYPITYAYAGNATTLGATSDSSRSVTVVTTYYWDGADTSENADGGDGTWDQVATANWDSSATGGSAFPWPTVGIANTAVLGGTAGTVSLGSGISVAGLTFNTTGYTLQNNTITFTANGVISASSNVTATISSALIFTNKAIEVLGGGTVNLSGGTTGYAADKFVVDGGTTVNWTGTGTLGDGDNYVGLGDAKGPGILNVTAGSLTIKPPPDNFRSFFIGYDSSTSRLNVSGGIVLFTNTATIRIAAGNGFASDTFATKSELTVSGTGTFTTGTLGGLLFLADKSTKTGMINLDAGGTFATLRSFTKGLGTAVINFNGGTLQATGGNTNWIALSTANVRDNGAIIDIGTFSVTNAQALVHSTIEGDNVVDGGLTKLGSGTLTLSGVNTYTGPTVVSNGVFSITRENGLPSSTDLTLASGAVMDLNFTGTNTIKSLTVANKLKYRNMVYSAANLPSVITGTGCLRTTDGTPQGLIIQFF